MGPLVHIEQALWPDIRPACEFCLLAQWYFMLNSLWARAWFESRLAFSSTFTSDNESVHMRECNLKLDSPWLMQVRVAQLHNTGGVQVQAPENPRV